MLDTSKNQSESLDDLKEKLRKSESLNQEYSEKIESWKDEKEVHIWEIYKISLLIFSMKQFKKLKDLVDQKNGLQNELYSYMSQLSNLKIHTESIQSEHQKETTNLEEIIRANNLITQEKELLVK